MCVSFPRAKLCLHMVGKADYPAPPLGSSNCCSLAKRKTETETEPQLQYAWICMFVCECIHSASFIHSSGVSIIHSQRIHTVNTANTCEFITGSHFNADFHERALYYNVFYFYFQLYDHKCPKGPLIYITNFCAFLCSATTPCPAPPPCARG